MLPFVRQLPARDSWKICRFSAPRPEPRFAQEPPVLAPFRRLFRFSASADHQMTPALFAGLFALARSRPAHWRTGCRDPLRGPSDLKHHAACREGCGLGAHVGPRPPCTFCASGRGRLTPFLSRHAGLREGQSALGGAFSTSFPAFQKHGCAGPARSSEELREGLRAGGAGDARGVPDLWQLKAA